jgi:F-type H+-transporting ATPase subunit a
MNLFGLLHLGFTLNGQLIIPVVLAVSFNLFFFLNGFERHGIKFLSVFVPSGVPAFLLPLVVLIEIISYLLRSFSLSVRLFANMMAGHTLLYILSSFVVALSDISLILALVPTLLVFAVSFLEIGIAFLQAYVFVVLLSIYVTDSLSPQH